MKRMIPALLLPAILLGGAIPSQAQSLHPSLSSLQIAQANGVDSIANTFIDLLAEGQYSQALQWYDAAVADGISSESLGVTWQDIEATNGELQNQIRSQIIALDEQSISQAVIITCEFEQGTRDLLITFSGDQIVGFSLVEG